MSDLQRRRELTGLTKPELIDWIVQVERSLEDARTALNALRQRTEDPTH
jgi:hypothetical protein